MELTDNERKIIEAKRAGAEINIYFHNIESSRRAKALIEEFKPTEAETKEQASEGSTWFRNSIGEEFDIAVFYKEGW